MVALDALMACLEDCQPLDRVLERDRRYSALAARDKALVRTVTSEACRRLGQIDDLIGACLDRPLTGRARTVRSILRLGVAQLLFLGFAPHAAIDTSVDLAHARARGMAPLVNAVLRKLQKEGASMVTCQDAVRLNTPGWLLRSWQDAWGAAGASAVIKANMKRADLDISVTDDAEGWAERLGGRVLPTGSLRVPASGAVTSLPGYALGRWWVQDAAASIPARLLGDIDGKDVLDLCAAPGGKTAQLAAAGARVTALDRSEERMQRLRANMERLGFDVRTIVADAATWRSETPFDAVLLDAPCSGTGTIRRHPDILWTRTRDDPGAPGEFAAATDRERTGEPLSLRHPRLFRVLPATGRRRGASFRPAAMLPPRSGPAGRDRRHGRSREPGRLPSDTSVSHGRRGRP